MSSLLEAHDPFGSELPEKNPSAKPASRITWSFNVSLLAVLCGLGIFRFLMSGRAYEIPAFGVLVSVAADFVRAAVFVLLSALLLQTFWRRLIPSLTGVREIDYREAVAISLMIGILCG